MQKTNIEYLTYVWNPVTGCTAISAGCKNCWARVMARRLQAIGIEKYRNGFAPTVHYDCFNDPLKLKKPARIGVSFMGDLFHDDIDFAIISQVYSVMQQCPQHDFYVLTKQAKRMAEFGRIHWWRAGKNNIWHGVTIENQAAADERLPHLVNIPGKKWVSVEPLLEAVDLFVDIDQGVGDRAIDRLNWIVVGCESGPGRRPCDSAWIEHIIGQADEAGVPVFVKQISISGRVSHTPLADHWPERLIRTGRP